MHRLLVWTGKGGTGKTTTVANAGPELARLGYRVLMVGFDPQGDLEATFGIDDADTDIIRVEQLLAGGIDPRTATVPIDLGNVGEGSLRLLASSSDLLAATSIVARRNFEDLDRLLEAFDDIDVALIDTQGALTPISHTAARAADSVLFTMEPGYYELRALVRRLADLEDLSREEDWTITPLGVLFVRSDSRSRDMREYREHFADADAFGGEPLYVFDAHTRQQASVRDHPRLALPTVLAEPGSNVAADYRAVAAELIARITASAGAHV
ncbi:MAG: ParA family protein [Chloroflexota bacterium]|nr:ParA family protein [Chloroflexota bacterium]